MIASKSVHDKADAELIYRIQFHLDILTMFIFTKQLWRSDYNKLTAITMINHKEQYCCVSNPDKGLSFKEAA